jgi:hypothetical protein
LFCCFAVVLSSFNLLVSPVHAHVPVPVPGPVPILPVPILVLVCRFVRSHDRVRNEPFTFELGRGNVIKCWDKAFATMTLGEKAIITCRSDFAYGPQGAPPKIPADATLRFSVELVAFNGPKKAVPTSAEASAAVAAEGEGAVGASGAAEGEGAVGASGAAEPEESSTADSVSISVESGSVKEEL